MVLSPHRRIQTDRDFRSRPRTRVSSPCSVSKVSQVTFLGSLHRKLALRRFDLVCLLSN